LCTGYRNGGDLGDRIGIDHFGASAPGSVPMHEYGLAGKEPCLIRRNGLISQPVMEDLESTEYPAHYRVVDFGDSQAMPDDDYPDFVAPLASGDVK
jgi:hypothetical protein